MLVTETLPTFMRAHRTPTLLIAIVILGMTCTAAATAADGRSRLSNAAPPVKRSAARVDADASAVSARPPQLVRRSNSRRQSVTANSAAAPQRRVGEQIRQVGFFEDYGAHGPVCDCNECVGFGPTCGTEGGYLIEPNCGLELNGGLDPNCGLEVSCGLEPSYGLEPACGIESLGDACGCDACSSGIGACDGFAGDSACRPTSFPLFLPILRVDWSRFEFFYGTHAFLNPMNVPAAGAGARANSGSFGFHEGFNEGRDLNNVFGADLSAQFGLRATQSNLEGQSFTDQHRNQIFITGGLFRRVDYGLQFGAVLDYLNDDWYYHADLLQLRGELSWKLSPRHNFGFHWMAGLNDDTVPTMVTTQAGTVFNGTRTVGASDQFRAFYRYGFGSTGQWTSYLGGTDNDHFILGSDMDVPLKGGLSMNVGSTYFAPTGDSTVPKYQAEGWNIGISMVYRPGCSTASSRYRRPMFNVADNGSFFVF